jgi:hypothetical protein
MALTLAEASKLSNDVLLVGVIETIIKDSPILQALPFIEMTSNHLAWARLSALRGSGCHRPQPRSCQRRCE